MGLAPSTTRVPTTEPTIFSFSELEVLTPLVMPTPEANCAVSITVKNTPPSFTNFCSFATPSQPRAQIVGRIIFADQIRRLRSVLPWQGISPTCRESVDDIV